MDSFEETLHKSQEAGESIKLALQKDNLEKIIQKGTSAIDIILSKPQPSKEQRAEMDKFFRKVQNIMNLNVDSAFQSVEAAVVPQAADVGFVPNYITPKELAEILKHSKRVVFLTGNGICAGLGLPQYRHHEFNLEDSQQKGEEIDQALLLTRTCFNFNRKAGWKWISNYEQAMQKAEPTQTHILLDDLAEKLGRQGRKVSMVTENIDNYHQQVQQARKVKREVYQYPILPMHGNIMEIRCCHCSHEQKTQWIQSYEMYAEILKIQCRLYCRCCEGPLKPNIMFHDERYSQLYNHSETILGLAGEADAVVVVGSVSASSLTKEVISIALEKNSRVIQIGSKCQLQRLNVCCIEMPMENALLEIKQQLGQ